MLLLLPPSEGKAAGSAGPQLDLDALSFPDLTRTRRALVTDLQRLARRRPEELRTALGLSDGQLREVDKDAVLTSAPTLPVSELYTGVLYDTFAVSTLRGAARRRAEASVVVASALFGLLRLPDRVPSYRLSGGTALPGLPPLATRWRPVLEPLLDAADGLVVDLRSGDYARLARTPHAVRVRVLREVGGKRSVVSHDNKWTKGLLARELCRHGARTPADVAELGRGVADDVEPDGLRVDLVLHGLASGRPAP